MIEIDYEVIGYDGDDGEWCAGASSKDEAYQYAMQYRDDYERVEVIKVIREVECTVSGVLK